MNRLKELRVSNGYATQQDLAKAIQVWAGEDRDKQVTYPSIARMEAGGVNPRWNIVNALAHFFGVSAEYLMGAE